MTSRTQGVVVAALAALLIRISVTGEYLRFVTPWMRWPLLVAGTVMLLLAARPALGRSCEAGRVPATAWLLLLPTLVAFSVGPPPLGAFLAERRATQPAALSRPDALPVATAGEPLVLGLEEFAWGAAQPDDPMGLTNQPLTMDGFVSKDPAGGWDLTHLTIFCCAADAVVMRAKILGAPSPPRDQWVRVTGTWVEGTGSDPRDPVTLQAESIVKIEAPKDAYG